MAWMKEAGSGNLIDFGQLAVQ